MPPKVFEEAKDQPLQSGPPAEDLSDEVALVEQARQGDAEAFGLLVDRYYRRIYGVVYRMCGPDDAEDLTQEIFLKALGALRSFQFQGQASFRTWLYRIAVNAAINELRRRKRRRQVEGPSLDSPVSTDDGEVERELPDETMPTPAQAAEQTETQRMVHEVLNRLRPQHRLVLTLVDLEGLEYKEAARVLRCPLGTLKSRVARARDAFAREFEKYRREQEEERTAPAPQSRSTRSK